MVIKLGKLNLFWKSKDNKTFNLGMLNYENSMYTFIINRQELKGAITNGCYGIGNFDLKRIEYLADCICGHCASMTSGNISRHRPQITKYAEEIISIVKTNGTQIQ